MRFLPSCVRTDEHNVQRRDTENLFNNSHSHDESNCGAAVWAGEAADFLDTPRRPTGQWFAYT